MLHNLTVENADDFCTFYFQAFGPRSPLVPYFSRAIVKVTQDDIFEDINNKYSPNGILSEDQSVSIDSDSRSLTLKNIIGLFLIVAIVFTFSILLSLGKLLYQLFNWEEGPFPHPPNLSEPGGPTGQETSVTIDGTDEQSRTHNNEGDNLSSNKDTQTLPLEGPSLATDAISQHSRNNEDGQDSVMKRLAGRIKVLLSRVHVWKC